MYGVHARAHAGTERRTPRRACALLCYSFVRLHVFRRGLACCLLRFLVTLELVEVHTVGLLPNPAVFSVPPSLFLICLFWPLGLHDLGGGLLDLHRERVLLGALRVVVLRVLLGALRVVVLRLW